MTHGSERLLFNPKPVGRFDDAPSRAPLTYHRKLPGYARSRLVEASQLAQKLGVGRLWLKDESQRLGLPSFKILGASWAVYRALEEHVGGLPEWSDLSELRAALTPHVPLALAAPTDGNHGRAVARMAKLLGLGATIYVPHGTAMARIQGGEVRDCRRQL